MDPAETQHAAFKNVLAEAQVWVLADWFGFWISFYNLCTFGGVNVFDTQLPCLKMTIILLPLVLICLYEMMSMKQLA